MALLLREEDVHAVLTMSDTIRVVEKAFVALAQDKATNRPRIRMLDEHGVMHLLAASVPSMEAMGYKTYTVFRSGMRFVVMLFSTNNGQLLSIIEAEWLGTMRTGATSAIATNYMARPESSQVVSEQVFHLSFIWCIMTVQPCIVRRLVTRAANIIPLAYKGRFHAFPSDRANRSVH